MRLQAFLASLVGLVLTVSVAHSRTFSDSLDAMKMLSSQTGWALNSGALFWTTDGGSHWKNITPVTKTKHALTDASFLDATTGWALLVHEDESGDLQFDQGATTDSGTTWAISHIKVSQQVPDEFTGQASIYFFDRLNGWIDLVVRSGSAFRPGKLLVTRDGGKTWNSPPKDPGRAGTLCFFDQNNGLLAGGPENTELYVTHDGSTTWQSLSFKAPASVGQADFPTYGVPMCGENGYGFLPVTYSGPAGVKSVLVLFASTDGGRIWRPDRVLAKLEETSPGQTIATALTGSTLMAVTVSKPGGVNLTSLSAGGTTRTVNSSIGGEPFAVFQASFVEDSRGWVLESNGLLSTSDGGLTWTDISPRSVPNSARNSGDIVENDPATIKPVAQGGLPPTGSSTEIRMGFDKSLVPKPTPMSQWWKFSPYSDSGLYLPGAVNKKKDPNLNPQWVSAVESYGWGLISIWVGPQAPCAIQKGLVSIQSKNPYGQGQAEAGKAIAAAAKLSSTLGPVIYYNMENYDTSNSACRALVRNFLNGWINGMKAKNYLAGVYGNIAPAVLDFSKLSPLPDDAWITWTPVPKTPPHVSIWGLTPQKGPALCDPFSKSPCTLWSASQRIHQFVIDHKETWGGVGFSIDDDIVDADVSFTTTGSKNLDFNYESIDYPSAKLTNALGIDTAGDIVGYFDFVSNVRIGFLDVGGQFTRIEYPNAAQTEAWGINDGGQIVGFYIDASSNFHGFVTSYPYDNQNYTPIDLGDGTFTLALGINDDNQIVGYYKDSNGYHGFLDNTNNGMITPINDGTNTLVRNIDGDALIVGLIQGSNSYLYDAVSKNFSPFNLTMYGVNDSREMVGGNIFYDFQFGTQTTLDYPSSTGTAAFDIDDYNEIVGNWYDSSGAQHGFIATVKQQ